MERKSSAYDGFAERYDDFYSGEAYLLEDRELMNILLPEIQRGRSILDCGSGTGLLWDYLGEELENRDYLGFDPSWGMVKIAEGKHSGAKFFCGDIFDIGMEKKFDLILGLYGVGAYMSPVGIIVFVQNVVTLFILLNNGV